jgi:protein-L-isoaspartate O-methyltransferase
VGAAERTHWVQWHDQYRDPTSPLSKRLVVVKRLIDTVLDEQRGPVQVISICAGAGLDVLGVLENREGARSRVRALLVERDPTLADSARSWARELGCDGVEVRTGDAAETSQYVDFAPADVVLVCGVFGNLSDLDIQRVVGALGALCRTGGSVIWTRHRRAPDKTPEIRAWFANAGFEERAFESAGEDGFGVGRHVLAAPGEPLVTERRLFTFLPRP